MFEYLKQPRNYANEKWNLFQGVTDFGNLVQFNMYESGYAAMFCLKMPNYLTVLAGSPDGTKYADLINSYQAIVEKEFKSLDGLADIESDALEINDGINTLEVVGKVTMQGSTQFTMKVQEKSGSPITKLHELYLTGLRDPRGGQVKHYHGLIGNGTLEPGFENETFTYLYINTDNTMRNIEKAYLLLAAQPTTAKTSIYNYEKGNIEFQDVDIEFRAFPVTGDAVNEKAQLYLDWLHNPNNKNHIIVNSDSFDYSINTVDNKISDIIVEK